MKVFGLFPAERTAFLAMAEAAGIERGRADEILERVAHDGERLTELRSWMRDRRAQMAASHPINDAIGELIFGTRS